MPVRMPHKAQRLPLCVTRLAESCARAFKCRLRTYNYHVAVSDRKPLGNPRFPLKGSFEGDMDIGIDPM